MECPLWTAPTFYEAEQLKKQHENGEWRYRVHTGKMTVIVRFEDETELMIVTAWRK